MAWEIAVAVNCLIPLVYWICIDRRYTVMMQRLDKVTHRIEKHMVGMGLTTTAVNGFRIVTGCILLSH